MTPRLSQAVDATDAMVRGPSISTIGIDVGDDGWLERTVFMGHRPEVPLEDRANVA